MIFHSEIRQNLLQTTGRNHIPIHYRSFQWNKKVMRCHFSTHTLSGGYVRETEAYYLPTTSVEKITVSLVDE
jgi:hypothetical protein